MAQTSKCRGVATTVMVEATIVSVTYHNTEVARKHNRTVTLNAGKWRTVTTKRRINQFANEFCDRRFSVYQKDFMWYVRIGEVDLEFENGITFDPWEGK